MKKQMAILLGSVAAVVLTLTGCAYGSAGNPTELTGTWNASYTSGINNDANALVGIKAGTYTKTTVTYPEGDNGINTTTSTTGATATVTKEYNSTITTTTTYTITIGTDGSVTNTTVTTYNKAARDAAPTLTPNTTVGGVTYDGLYLAAQVAGTGTLTHTYTYTVVANADGKTYTEKEVETNAYSNFSGSYSPAPSDSSTTSFSYNKTKDQIKANALSVPSDYTATATTSNESSTANISTVTTTDLVVQDDGNYTKTTTATKTATDSASNGAGTAVETIVETGTVTGNTTSADKCATFTVTGRTITDVGTGSLISVNYPSTSTTYTDAATWSYQASYYIVNNKLVMTFDYGNSISVISYTKASN